MQYVSSINLAAKVANFRLTAKKTREKISPLFVGCSQSTHRRKISSQTRNRERQLSVGQAQDKAMERQNEPRPTARRIGHRLGALDLLKEEDCHPNRSQLHEKPWQNIPTNSYQTHNVLTRAGNSRPLPHKMKYNRPDALPEHKSQEHPGRVSIHERPRKPMETVRDWEMDISGGQKTGKGAIVTLTERSTNMVLMEKLPQGKRPEPAGKDRHQTPVSLTRHTVRSITTTTVI